MPTLLIVQLGLGRIIQETESDVDCDPREISIVLDSFLTASINEEGNPISVVYPSVRPIDEYQHGIITSDRARLPSHPNDNAP